MAGASSSNTDIIVYMECLRARNGKVGDGCMMFLPEPSVVGGFVCAKCGCSRECHRRVALSHEEAIAVDVLLLGFTQPTGKTTGGGRGGGGTSGEASAGNKKTTTQQRKRRTCFTEEQQRQMEAFSERLGWNKTRRNDRNNAMKHFCNLLGVRTQSVKTWIRNHRKRLSSISHNTVISISSDDETSL